jgi:hypothetical protein
MMLLLEPVLKRVIYRGIMAAFFTILAISIGVGFVYFLWMMAQPIQR